MKTVKKLAFIFLFIIFLSFGTQAQDHLDLISKRIDNELLVKILNLSQMKELKPPRPVDSIFFLRLYSLDDISNNEDDEDDLSEYCTPEVETEVVCSYRYFLAVHDGSLGVSGAVYDLGKVGEITKIEWLKSPDQNFARLRLEVSNYPIHAFKLNPKLVKKTKIVEITVNMDDLKIKVIK
jgi:hypothetical protein